MRKRLKTLLAVIIIFTLIIVSLPVAPEVKADTTTKTFSFATTAESFVGTPGAESTLSYDSGTGNPVGALKSRILGRNKVNDNYWEWAGTWEDLGVPAGGTVTQIRVNAGYTQCTEYNVADPFTVGPYELRDSGGTLIATLWSGRTGTAVDGSWVSISAQADQNVTAGNQASNTTIKLRLNNHLDNGNDGAAAISVYDDEVSYVITYTAAVPTLTQNSFEYWVDNNTLTPVEVWGNPDIGEKVAFNAVPPSNDPIDPGDEIRIRIQVSVTTTQLDAATEGFILAYAEANDCSAVPAWTDVGVAGGADTWLYTSETNVTDNTTLTSNLITGSEVYGRYNRSDPTSTNPNAIPSGQEVEWDWHVVYNSSNTAGAKTYCFRMEKDDGTALDGYNTGSYPRIDTRPATIDQSRHGNFFTSGSERGFFWSN
jgi:hypothetical protein